jgi:hypothetical protein
VAAKRACQELDPTPDREQPGNSTVNKLNIEMHLADPTTWHCPLAWHPDCDGPWELDRLRELALAFLKPCREHWVRLEIMETRHVRAEFFRGLQRLGVACVARPSDGRNEAMFRLCLGAAGSEQTARVTVESGVAQAVQRIIAAKTACKSGS